MTTSFSDSFHINKKNESIPESQLFFYIHTVTG